MNAHELLLQRFIDNELSHDEQRQLLEALHDDPDLRRQLLEMERIVADAEQLPRLVPSRESIRRVMEHLEPMREPAASASVSQGLISHLRDFFFAPHALEWTFARAVVMACGLVALTWITSVVLLHPPAGPMTQAVLSAPLVYVRVALLDPEAQSVAIAGDFNGWDPRRTQLRRTSNGLWTLTIPLKPGRYQYMYQVDGRWVTDPLASESSPDGFGEENAVLDVREITHHEGRSLEDGIIVQ